MSTIVSSLIAMYPFQALYLVKHLNASIIWLRQVLQRSLEQESQVCSHTCNYWLCIDIDTVILGPFDPIQTNTQYPLALESLKHVAKEEAAANVRSIHQPTSSKDSLRITDLYHVNEAGTTKAAK